MLCDIFWAGLMKTVYPREDTYHRLETTNQALLRELVIFIRVTYRIMGDSKTAVSQRHSPA